MPLPVEPKLEQDNTIYSISGINLSADSELAGNDSMLEIVDFDLFKETGVAVARQPAKVIDLLDNIPTMVTEYLGSLYSGTLDGTLYINGKQLDTGYGPQIVPGLYAEGDRSILYLASSTQMKKVVNHKVTNWGLTPPSKAPSLTAVSGLLNAGTYQYSYTYVEKSGDTVVQESNPSPINSISFTSIGSVQIQMDPSSESEVTHMRLYRTQQDGGTLLFEREFNDTGATVTYRSVISDTGLGSQISNDNDQPFPSNVFAIHRGRGWISDGINVFYSQNENLNYWPQLNFLPIGSKSDPVVSIVSSAQGLAIFTKNRRYVIVESLEDVTAIGQNLPFFGGSSSSFFSIESSSVRGTISQSSAKQVEGGILYMSDNGLYLTNLRDVDSSISQNINGIFRNKSTDNIPSIDQSYVYISIEEYSDKYYISYSGKSENRGTLIFLKDSQSWYFYSIGFSSFHQSKEHNVLYGGLSTIDENDQGQIVILDNYGLPSMETITASMRTHDLNFGHPFTKKALNYLYVDSDIKTGETITGTLYIDGLENRTFTVSSSKKVRFPPGVFGETFAVNLSFSGMRRLKIRGLRFIWVPMRMG